MQYGVPGDVDITDLDDISGPDDLIFGIIGWSEVERVETHTDDDGDEADHMMQMWFPAVVDPCAKAGTWHGPGATYFGPMHIFDSRRTAYLHASRLIKKLNRDRVELDRGLADLTAEAATERE